MKPKYHVFIPLFFHHWHEQRGDNSSLDVQDVDRLIILGVEFDLGLSFNCDLQGVPVDVIYIKPLSRSSGLQFQH